MEEKHGCDRMNDKTAIETIRALKRNAENDMPDYDYGWDAAIDEAIKALAAIGAEKPGEAELPCMDHNCSFFDRSSPQNCDGECNGEPAIASCGSYQAKLKDIQSFAASYHAEQCKACSCNGCDNEGQGMPICEMCQRNPNRSEYYTLLPEAPK